MIQSIKHIIVSCGAEPMKIDGITINDDIWVSIYLHHPRLLFCLCDKGKSCLLDGKSDMATSSRLRTNSPTIKSSMACMLI